MAKQRQIWQSVKLNKEAFDAVTLLKSRTRMPVSFNGLVNYLILCYGIPEFYRRESGVRGIAAKDKQYKDWRA